MVIVAKVSSFSQCYRDLGSTTYSQNKYEASAQRPARRWHQCYLTDKCSECLLILVWIAEKPR